MERPQDYVQRRIEERGIRLVRLWFTDVQGQLKSFAISPAELETAFESGMSAISTTMLTYLKPGDVLIYGNPDYGGTHHFITHF